MSEAQAEMERQIRTLKGALEKISASQSLNVIHHIAALIAKSKNALPALLASAERESRLEKALQDACSNCPTCGGSGDAYTHHDETEVGSPPGSSRVDCPNCTSWRAALNGEDGE